MPGALPNEDTVQKVCKRLSPYWAAGSGIGYKLIRFRPLGVRAPYRGNKTPDDALMERLHAIVLKAGCRSATVI